MEASKFKLTSDGIEISGTEAFVERQLSNYKELIQTSFEKILEHRLTINGNRIYESSNNSRKAIIHKPLITNATDDTDYIELKDNETIKYENVLVIDHNKVQIICDVPGNSTSKKMVSVILIYMWAKLKQGVDSVSSQELRQVCEAYGEYDYSNFTKYLDNRKYFLLSGGTKTVKLIRPGIKEAERLIKELNSKN